MVLQGMRELGLGVVNEVASDAQCQCAVCVCLLHMLRPWALEPRRAPSHFQGSASSATCTGGGGTKKRRHEAEQCAGIAVGFEEVEECEGEHLGRRGAGANHQKCASANAQVPRGCWLEFPRGMVELELHVE